MIGRFDRDVFAENPDLVIWQVGSNSVLRDRPLNEANAQLRDGLKRLKAAGADVVLINPQYAPKVITKHDVDRMVDLIDATARDTHVDLFQRFALMRYWRLTEDIPFSRLPVAGRAAHERLELRLRRQAAGKRDRRGGDPRHGNRYCRHEALIADLQPARRQPAVGW